jgi:hypothetical protein
MVIQLPPVLDSPNVAAAQPGIPNARQPAQPLPKPTRLDASEPTAIKSLPARH